MLSLFEHLWLRRCSVFDKFHLIFQTIKFFVSSCSYFNEVLFANCIPFMERKTKSSVIRLLTILFDKIDEAGDMREVIFISLLNFHIGTDILFYSILSVAFSISIVIFNKMRIVHHIF